MKAYLCIGSNLGDRQANVKGALQHLGAGVTKASSVYETQPIGKPSEAGEGWFLNCVVEFETTLEPLALLNLTQEIEHKMGRARPGKSLRMGPRTLDIDILLYENRVMQTSKLTLPHPRLAERRFVLEPLAEIAPDMHHPVTHLSVRAMLSIVKDKSEVRPAK